MPPRSWRWRQNPSPVVLIGRRLLDARRHDVVDSPGAPGLRPAAASASTEYCADSPPRPAAPARRGRAAPATKEGATHIVAQPPPQRVEGLEIDGDAAPCRRPHDPVLRRPRRRIALAEPLQPLVRRRDLGERDTMIIPPGGAASYARRRAGRSQIVHWLIGRGLEGRPSSATPSDRSAPRGVDGTSSLVVSARSRSFSSPPAAASAAPSALRPPGPSRSCPTRRCRARPRASWSFKLKA